MTKTNVQLTPSNSQHHDTPNNKTHVIKFRVTAEEKASLELTCKLLNLSLSTFIRRAIHNVKIEKTVIVAGGEETLTAVSILMALNITMLGVLAILAVCQQTGRCEREIAALKGVEQVGFPQLRLAMLIQKLLSGERVVLVNEVRFDGGVV